MRQVSNKKIKRIDVLKALLQDKLDRDILKYAKSGMDIEPAFLVSEGNFNTLVLEIESNLRAHLSQEDYYNLMGYYIECGDTNQEYYRYIRDILEMY